MQKDFDRWNGVKKKTHAEPPRLYTVREIMPLTTSTHEHPLRVPIGLVDGQEARANLSQMRVVDTRRLTRKVGFLEKAIFTELRKAARDMFSSGSSSNHSFPLAGARPKPTVQI